MIASMIEKHGNLKDYLVKVAEQFHTRALNKRCLTIYSVSRNYNLSIFEGIERRGILFRKQDEVAINSALKHGWKMWVRTGNRVRDLDTNEIERLVLSDEDRMMVEITMKHNPERIKDGTYISSFSLYPENCGMDPE